MRKMTALLLVLLVALAAAACGDDAEETTTTAAATTTAAETTTTAAETTTTAAGEAILTIGETAFAMADLEALEVVTLTLEHPKNGATEYTGVRLNALLTLAGIDTAAATLTLTASDGYAYDAVMADVLACADCLAAFNDEGGINMAMPGMESKAWVKDTVEITAG